MSWNLVINEIVLLSPRPRDVSFQFPKGFMAFIGGVIPSLITTGYWHAGRKSE